MKCKGPCGANKPVDAFELRKDSGKRRPKCLICMNAYKLQKYDERRAKAGKPERDPDRFAQPPLTGKTKTCIGCESSKDLSLFPIRADSPDGHNNTCKDCKATYLKEYQLAIDLGERVLNVAPQITDEGKVCTGCEVLKPLTAYAVRADSPHGYRYECRECLLRKLHDRINGSENLQLKAYHSKLVQQGIILQSKNSAFEEVTGLPSPVFRGWFEFRFDMDGELSWDNYGANKLW